MVFITFCYMYLTILSEKYHIIRNFFGIRHYNIFSKVFNTYGKQHPHKYTDRSRRRIGRFLSRWYSPRIFRLHPSPSRSISSTHHTLNIPARDSKLDLHKSDKIRTYYEKTCKMRRHASQTHIEIRSTTNTRLPNSNRRNYPTGPGQGAAPPGPLWFPEDRGSMDHDGIPTRDTPPIVNRAELQ